MKPQRPGEFGEGRRFGLVCFQKLKRALQPPVRQPTLNVGRLTGRGKIRRATHQPRQQQHEQAIGI